MIATNIHATAALWKYLSAHQVAFTAGAVTIAGWSFNAYASTLPEPPPGASRRTQFWYRLVHTAAANLDKLKR
jgi:hypothetical protein